MQAQAVGCPGALEHRRERRGQQLGVAHFDGDRDIRSPGQCHKHRFQPLQELRQAAKPTGGQGADLKDQRPGFRSQTLHGRPDELGGGKLRAEERGIRLQPTAVFAAHERIGDQAGRLDDEPEMIGHLRCVGRVLTGGQRPVEHAVQADGAKQGVLRVRRQALP